MEIVEFSYLPNEIMESMLGDLQSPSPSKTAIFSSVTPCLTKNWGDLPLKVDDSEDMVIYGILRDALSVGWVPFGLRSQGQENAVCHQVAARGMENVIYKHSLNIEGLTGYVSANASQRKQVAKECAHTIKPDGINVTKKLNKLWTLDKEYRISRNVLEQHSEKKLGEVAEILGVSRSTLKRICRKHHIVRWPPCNAKKFKRYLTQPESVQTTQENVEESTRRNQRLYNSTQEKNSISNAQTKSNATDVPNHSSMTVKATYEDDIIKFQLSVSSTKLDLEEEVATRLRLSVGSFKIKYLDEDGDWVLIACDTDLRTCISTLASVGKTTAKMLVC